MEACPLLPAAAILIATTAGTSITATSTSARFRSVPAFPTIRTAGACGSYPGSEPGQHVTGTAATFEEAREGFEAAWQVYLARRTEADFQAWRGERAWQTQKRAMWERGELLPSQKPNSRMRCACGETFDSHLPAHTLIHVPHITAPQQLDGIRR